MVLVPISSSSLARRSLVGAATRSLSPSIIPSRAFASPSRILLQEEGGQKESQPTSKQGILKSLLHGSPSAKAEGPTTFAQSHSQQVARGKYIHEIQRQSVRPDKVEQYRQLIGEYFPKLASQGLPVRLTGSWEVTVGDLETFYHIWEYDGYAGFDQAHLALSKDPAFQKFQSSIRQLLSDRSNWLTQEFSFWPSSPPRTTNGLYELRTYHLKPGHLLEWEQHWRRGLEARRKFVEPIGAWFTQIGGLHTVFHIWEYPSLEERKRTRDAAWQVETWNDTVSQTVKLIDKMHAQIMVPLPFSPLK
ncbi:NIPSNAP-domain-containing protein [Violaceomyces palustris]|uniref:NIPSNAP-domain-containing protein n=1 Tax=Violaceomyces palustris TaxID=1673888 RepID=A0ACD0NLJ6_9BASI|nr:NIPSNAP-domain-containing protein [Violaceomyces palustris]